MKKLIQTYMNDVWNLKDTTAVVQYVDPDVIIHSLLGEKKGSTQLIDVIEVWVKAFPDLTYVIEHIIQENDMVSAQWIAKGTHLGEFKGRSPTGKTVSYKGVSVYRLKNNKIVEYWGYIDMHHLLSQI